MCDLVNFVLTAAEGNPVGIRYGVVFTNNFFIGFFFVGDAFRELVRNPVSAQHRKAIEQALITVGLHGEDEVKIF